MERKIFPAFVTKIDEDQGIVDAIVAVMGNIDEGDDLIHNGSFSKTIVERGGKVRVLDAHNTDSIMRVLGKPILIKEVGREELPPEVLLKYPEATGGLFTRTQYFLDTPEGKGAFIRIKRGGVDEYSIGYDAMKGGTDYGKSPDGRTIRNLRELRLWEYSPVLFGMNPATATLSAKDNDKEDKGEPSEGKPYGVFMDGDQHCVYKLDEDGERTGESLGCHDAEDDAMAQMRALYAEEKDDKEAEGEDAQDEKEMTPHGPVQRLGDVLQGSIHQTFTMMADSYYIQGLLDREERIMLSSLIGDALDILTIGIPEEVAMREISGMGMYMMSKPIDLETKAGRVLARRNADRIMNAMNLLHEALMDAGLMEMPEEEDEDKSTTAPEEAADKQQDSDTQAGPDTPPTSKELELIEISLRELELLEV